MLSFILGLLLSGVAVYQRQINMEYVLIGLFIAGVTVFLATSFFCCVYKTEDKEKENPIKKLLNGREVYELFRRPPEIEWIEWDKFIKRLQGKGGANYLTFSRIYLKDLFRTLNFLSLQTDLDIPLIVIYVGRYKFIIDSTPMDNLVGTFVRDSEAEMLALTAAEQGDVCLRTDISKSFILAGNDPSDIDNWIGNYPELLSPIKDLNFKGSIRKYKIVTGEPEKLQKDTFRALSLNDLTKLRMALIDQITLLSEVD